MPVVILYPNLDVTYGTPFRHVWVHQWVYTEEMPRIVFTFLLGIYYNRWKDSEFLSLVSHQVRKLPVHVTAPSIVRVVQRSA